MPVEDVLGTLGPRLARLELDGFGGGGDGGVVLTQARQREAADGEAVDDADDHGHLARELGGGARELEGAGGRLAGLELAQRDVLEAADLLEPLAALAGEILAALEELEGIGELALGELGLAPRDRGVGHARRIAALLAELPRLGEVALGAIEIAEVGVGLADVAELERDAGAIAELLIELEARLVVREGLLVLAEGGERVAHVVERAGFLPRQLERAVDDERLGVRFDRRLEAAHVPERGALLVQDVGADAQRGGAVADLGGEGQRLLAQLERVVVGADQARDRRAQAEGVGLGELVAGVARELQRGGDGALGRGRLADVDVELREQRVGQRLLLRIAEGLGLLAQRGQLAELLRSAREAAQDLLALMARLEPPRVLAGRQELERAGELAERVGVAAELDGVGGGAQVAIGRWDVIAGELEVPRDVRVVGAGAVAGRGGDAIGDHPVQLGLVVGGHQTVRHGHDRVVLEAVLVVVGEQQPAAGQLVELDLHLATEQRGQRRRRDLASDHRGDQQRLLVALGQPIDPRDQQVFDGRRHLDRGVALGPAVAPGLIGRRRDDLALGQRVDLLEDEERVAAGAREDLLGQLGDVVVGGEPARDQAGPGRGVELVEVHDLGAGGGRGLEDALVGPGGDHAEDGTGRRRSEHRGEQLQALLIAPVHVFADDDQRLVGLEALLDAGHQREQALPALGGIAVAGVGRAHAEQHADRGQGRARVLAVLLAGEHQRHRHREAALHLVGLGAVGQAEDLAREIGDHAVGRHRGADPRGGAQEVRLAGGHRRQEPAHQRALADAVIAGDHQVTLAPADQRVAIGVAQALLLELAADQHVGAHAIAQPGAALLGAAQAVHARALDAGLGVLVDATGPGLRRRRHVDRGQRLEVPLGARAAEHPTADQDLGGAGEARQVRGEPGGGRLDLEALGLAAADHRGGAALDADREPQLGLDVGADAVERVDQRQRQADGAPGVVLAGERQPDHQPHAVEVALAAILERVVLERDVACDPAELVDDLGRAGRAQAPLERGDAADHALDDVDVLALAQLARLAAAIVGGAALGAGQGAERSQRAERAGGRPGRGAGGAGLARPPRRAPLERHHGREERRQGGRVDQLAGGVAPLELEPAEVGDQLARGRIAIVAVVRERATDDALEGGRHVGHRVAQRGDGAGLHLLERLLAAPGEQRPPGDELVEHDAGAPHVGATVDRFAARLLGRHVRELALDDALVLGDVARPCDAEVDDLHRAVPRHQHVLRRDVAVDDLQRIAELVGLLVRVVEALAELLHDVRGQAVRDAAALLGAVLQQAEQVEALDVLHRQEVGVADRAEVEHLDDVRVVEAERDLGLVDEHRDELPALGVGRVDLLDDQRLGEALRDGRAREEHLGHASGADLRHQRVFTELLHRQRTRSLAPLAAAAERAHHRRLITRLSK